MFIFECLLIFKHHCIILVMSQNSEVNEWKVLFSGIWTLLRAHFHINHLPHFSLHSIYVSMYHYLCIWIYVYPSCIHLLIYGEDGIYARVAFHVRIVWGDDLQGENGSERGKLNFRFAQGVGLWYKIKIVFRGICNSKHLKSNYSFQK